MQKKTVIIVSIMFLLLIVVVIALSVTMIVWNARAVKGNELFDIHYDEIESVTAVWMPYPQSTTKAQLTDDEIRVLSNELNSCMLIQTFEDYDGAGTLIEIAMKDGSTRSISLQDGDIAVDGQRYEFYGSLQWVDRILEERGETE